MSRMCVCVRMLAECQLRVNKGIGRSSPLESQSARGLRKAEVGGSNPLPSTNRFKSFRLSIHPCTVSGSQDVAIPCTPPASS